MQTSNPVIQSLGPERQRLFEKIAVLLIHGVAQEEVAKSVELTPGAISQIKEDKRFVEVYEREKNRIDKNKEEIEEINSGWDGLERRALEKLGKLIEINPDPDLMLRAAAVANKAIRRGRGNEAIPASQGGVVNLAFNNVYVDKLNNGKTTTPENVGKELSGNDGKVITVDEVEEIKPIKEEDLPLPHMVEKLLTGENKEHQELNPLNVIDANFDALIEEEKQKRMEKKNV